MYVHETAPQTIYIMSRTSTQVILLQFSIGAQLVCLPYLNLYKHVIRYIWYLLQVNETVL